MDGIERFDLSDLGARILDAARLATAVHQFQTVTDLLEFRQQVEIGGADPGATSNAPPDLSITDDALPATAWVVETQNSRRPLKGVGGPFGGPDSPSPAPDSEQSP